MKPRVILTTSLKGEQLTNSLREQELIQNPNGHSRRRLVIYLFLFILFLQLSKPKQTYSR